LPTEKNFYHVETETPHKNSLRSRGQERLYLMGSFSYFDFRHTVTSFRQQIYGHVEKCKGNFSKTPDGIFLKSFLWMRSVLFIVKSLRLFWYKTDMHPLQYFSLSHSLAWKKKRYAEAEDSVLYQFLNF
jgi:hypothetical protein